MRGLPVERDQRYAEDRDDRARGQDRGPHVRAGDVAQDRREARLLAREVLIRLRTDRGDRHEYVEGGHDDGREEDRERQIPAGVVYLLARRRDGVKADKEKKIDEAAAPMPAIPKGANGWKLLARKGREPDNDEQDEDPELDEDHDRVRQRGFPRPRTSSRQHSVTSTMAGRLSTPPSPGAASMASGMRKPNTSENSELEILRPPDRHGGGGDAVLEEQTRRHAEGHYLPHRGVGVGIRRAGDRDGRCELRVAHRRERGRDPREYEGHDDRRAPPPAPPRSAR